MSNCLTALKHRIWPTEGGYINVACPVTQGGKHYPGFAIHPGVNILPLVSAPCDINRKLLQLGNTRRTFKPVFYDGISSLDDKAKRPCLGYYQVESA